MSNFRADKIGKCISSFGTEGADMNSSFQTGEHPIGRVNYVAREMFYIMKPFNNQ